MVWALAALMAAGLLVLLLMLWALGRSAPGATAKGLPAAAATLQPAALPADVSTDVQALLRSASPTAGSAWRELALRWNVAVGEGDPCQVVPQAGLACLNSSSGGLALVRQLARPGVVALRTAQNTTVYALLVALNDERATLQVGSQRYSLALPELARIWRGEFSTLWRTPPGWATGRDNLEDSAIRRWVLQRLPSAETAGLVAATGTATATHTVQPLSTTEDPGATALRERLRVLQVAQGLPSDAAGLPVTLVQLNRRSGVAEPALPSQPAPLASKER